jgi:hypothetical protein
MIKRLVAAAVLTAFAGAVTAGFNYGAYDIIVNVTGKAAAGGVTMARRTPDAVQYLTCGSAKFVGGVASGNCYARDKNYAAGFCTTQDPEMISVIKSINPSSYVSFAWDDAGVCRYVTVSNSSFAI